MTQKHRSDLLEPARERRRPLVAVVPVSLAVGAALAWALPAAAQVAVDETVAAPASPTVRVESLSGSIRVVGSGSGQVRVTGTRGPDTEGVEVSVVGNEVIIVVVVPEEMEGDTDASADLVITVPTSSSVEVEGLAVDAAIGGVTGTVRAELAAGDVTVTGSPSRVETETLSGEVDVEVAGAPVFVSSAAGSVRVSGASGTVEVETLSGGVYVEGSSFERAVLNVTSGGVEFHGGLAAGGVLEVEALSGGVTVYLPASTSASLEASSFTGGIESDFDGGRISSERFTPAQTLRTTLGSGSGRISLQTFSGQIRIVGGG